MKLNSIAKNFFKTKTLAVLFFGAAVFAPGAAQSGEEVFVYCKAELARIAADDSLTPFQAVAVDHVFRPGRIEAGQEVELNPRAIAGKTYRFVLVPRDSLGAEFTLTVERKDETDPDGDLAWVSKLKTGQLETRFEEKFFRSLRGQRMVETISCQAYTD